MADGLRKRTGTWTTIELAVFPFYIQNPLALSQGSLKMEVGPLSKLGIEEDFLSLIKCICKTLQLAPHLMWKTECFSPQTGNTAEMTMPTDPSFLFNIKPERSPSQWKTRNINKSLQIGNKEIKLSLFVENIIAYVENPMESTKTNNYLN